MSVVLTTQGAQRMTLNLVSFMDNFWGMLTDNRIKPAEIALPDWETDSGGTTEQIAMFREWMISTQKKWPGFTRRWRFHFFPVDQRSQMMADWLPPIAYIAEAAPRYALPQYPQQRVRIPDPTDSKNQKRSIRVHYAEKNK